MTLALEHVQDGDWAAINRVIDKLRGLVLDTGGVSLDLRVGTTTLTFAAAATSGGTTVNHGLGRTPLVLFFQGFGALAFGNLPTVNYFGLTSTQFTINGEVKTAFTGTASIAWLAIG